MVVLVALSPGAALALARAPFPSASKLQPMPQSVAPNISGNVNSTLSPSNTLPPGATDGSLQQDTTSEEAPAASPDQSSSTGGGHTLWIFVGGVLVLALLCAWILRKKDPET